MDRRADLAASAGLVIVGVAIIAIAELTIKTGTVAGDLMGPRAMPLAVGAVLIVCAGATAVMTLVAMAQGAPASDVGAADDAPVPASGGRALTVIALTVAYALLLEPIGYVIATVLYLLAMLWVVEVRNRAVMLGSAGMLPLGLYVLFAGLLGVRLPGGLIDNLLDAMAFAR